MPTEKTLNDLFLDTLKDIYFAEKQILKALPKMARAAQSEEGKAGFLQHRDETQGQIERLEQVFELLGKEAGNDLTAVVATLKRLPLRLLRPRPMAEVISTAGGVRLDAMDEGLMLRAVPGVFCAGEMLDWEAPTGGYLLTACCATGFAAGQGAVRWLSVQA